MHIVRDFQEKYFDLIDRNTITVLLGPRRVGKSTFAEQYLTTKKNIEKIYLNFDSFSTRDEITKHGLEKLIPKTTNKNEIVIFIDEVQKVPRILEDIKIIFDKQKSKKEKIYKFLLTGSASLDIHKNVSETLAGRVNLLRIYPFSFQEAAKIKENFSVPTLEINKIFNSKNSFQDLIKHKERWDIPSSLHRFSKPLINELIEYGSLPEVLELNETEDKQRFLINYRDTYLEKDIRADTNVGDLARYSNLLTLLGSQSGSLIVKKDLKEKAGIAYDTLDSYLSILKATYILQEFEPYIFSASKRLVKSSKCYFCDNGILALLTGFLNFEQLLTTGLIGNRFENMVINEIIKKINPFSPIADFFFWRSSGGKEIDLIIDFKEKIIPCEIKWTDNISHVKIGALINFLKNYKKASYGIVIYNGDFFVDNNNKIIYLPISHLLYF